MKEHPLKGIGGFGIISDKMVPSNLLDDLFQEVTTIQKLSAEKAQLEQEMKLLKKELEELRKEKKGKVTFPESFHCIGDSPFAYRLSVEEVQEYVDALLEEELKEGQFVTSSKGDTIVIRMVDQLGDKTIVAKNYYEYVKNE